MKKLPKNSTSSNAISISVNVSVASRVDKSSNKDDKTILIPANKTFSLSIDYPLNMPRRFAVKSGKNGVKLTKLIDIICDKYHEAYKEDSNIWGHYIEDLYLESIVVDYENKEVRLEVGS